MDEQDYIELQNLLTKYRKLKFKGVDFDTFGKENINVKVYSRFDYR